MYPLQNSYQPSLNLYKALLHCKGEPYLSSGWQDPSLYIDIRFPKKILYLVLVSATYVSELIYPHTKHYLCQECPFSSVNLEALDIHVIESKHKIYGDVKKVRLIFVPT